jgi:Flp pilus assembly protein TadB
VTRIKLFLAVLGFCLALAGVVLENRPLVWAAMAVLAAALAVRLYLKRVGGRDSAATRRDTG